MLVQRLLRRFIFEYAYVHGYPWANADTGPAILARIGHLRHRSQRLTRIGWHWL
jgi:hypothetical protein